MAGEEPRMTYHFEPDWTVPPGATLREWLEENPGKAEQAAITFGFAPGLLGDILSGGAKVDMHIAILLASLTGIPVDMWTRLEKNYREGLAAGKKVVE